MSRTVVAEKKRPPALVYNSALERNLITLHNFDRTLIEIDRLRARPASLSIQLVVDTLKTNLQVINFLFIVRKCNFIFLFFLFRIIVAVCTFRLRSRCGIVYRRQSAGY